MKSRIYNTIFEFEVIVTNKNKHYPYQIPNRTEAICYIKPDSAYLYIKKMTHRVLVHECIHIAQWILHHKWIKTGYKNTEILAYVTDWIYNEVLKCLKKVWKK